MRLGALLAFVVVLMYGVVACGGSDSAPRGPEITSAWSPSDAAGLPERAARRPERYRYRLVAPVAVFNFAPPGGRPGWGAWFRVIPALPLQSAAARQRYRLVLRDVASNRVLSDSDALQRRRTRPRTACYVTYFDASRPLPLSRARGIGRVRVSLERLRGTPLGTASSVQLAAPQVRPVRGPNRSGTHLEELRQASCVR